jgi:heptosyltransferase I
MWACRANVPATRRRPDLLHEETRVRLLIVKTSSMGDVIHMLPAVSDAARAMPNLAIDWLVETPFAPIARWHPDVQQVLTLSMRRWRKQFGQRITWQEMGLLRKRLRAQPYDWVLDAQGLLKSALWARQANGLRVGYDWHSAREPLASAFYDQRHSVPKSLHAVARNRCLMAAVLGYEPPAQAPDYGVRALSKRLPDPGLHLPAAAVVGLHGTSQDNKRWPQAHWIRLGHALGARGQTLLLPWGNAAEHARAQEIAANTSASIVLPALGLDALAHLIDQAAGVVGVDTGLLHLAAALGKPGLALYPVTDPARTGAQPDRFASGPLYNIGAEQLRDVDAVIVKALSVIPMAYAVERTPATSRPATINNAITTNRNSPTP